MGINTREGKAVKRKKGEKGAVMASCGVVKLMEQMKMRGGGEKGAAMASCGLRVVKLMEQMKMRSNWGGRTLSP